MAEHRQLILAVAIDELCVGEEVEPVFDRRVERTEQPVTSKGPPLQELSCF